MANTYKAIAMANELTDKIRTRLPSLFYVQSFDTDGNPLIAITEHATGVAGEKNALVKVQPYTSPAAKDILGNTAFAYSPHIVQLVTEAPAAGSGAGVYLDLPTLAPLIEELMAKRARFEWYQSTNGSVPASTDIAAAKLKASVEPNVYWQGLANQ